MLKDKVILITGIDPKTKKHFEISMLNSPFIGRYFGVNHSDIGPHKIWRVEGGRDYLEWKYPAKLWNITHIPSGAAVARSLKFKTHAVQIAKMLEQVAKTGIWEDVHSYSVETVAKSCPAWLRENLNSVREDMFLLQKSTQFDVKRYCEENLQRARKEMGATSGEQISLL